jgi:hypothetical protein
MRPYEVLKGLIRPLRAWLFLASLAIHQAIAIHQAFFALKPAAQGLGEGASGVIAGGGAEGGEGP